MLNLRLIAIFLLTFAAPGVSFCAQELPKELQGVGIVDQLGKMIPIRELQFRNESGVRVPLSTYFTSGRPVILNLVYFQCANLCNYLLNGLVDSLKPMDWKVGKQFDIVTVSIEPKEGPDLASRKKAAYLQVLGQPEAAQGWHFLTGDEDQIKRLASEVGFGYKWDAEGKQWAHSAGLFVMTPEGKMSRVLHGMIFKERDFRLALVEASNGKVGTIIDKIILFCFHYDPQARGYTPYVFRVMQAGALSTVLILGTYLVVFWRRQRKGALSPC